MKWYYLALLIWIAEILMFASIVLLPVAIYLRNNNDWWENPFEEAHYAWLLG